MSSKRGTKGKGESSSGVKVLSSKKTKAGSSTPGRVGHIRSYFPSASPKDDDGDDAGDTDDADFDIAMASLSSDDEVVKKASRRPRQSTGASAKKADASSAGSSSGRGKPKANSSATPKKAGSGPRAGGNSKRPPGKSDEKSTRDRGAKSTAKAGGASGAKTSGKGKGKNADRVPATGDSAKTVSSPTTTTTTPHSRPSRAASTKKSRSSANADGDTDDDDEEDWDRDSSGGDDDESADEGEESDEMEKGGRARGKRGRRQSATVNGASKKARSSASATTPKPETKTNGDIRSKQNGKERGKEKGKGKAATPKKQKARGSPVGSGRRLSSLSARVGGSDSGDLDAESKSLLSDELPEDEDKRDDEQMGSGEVAVNKSDSDEDDDDNDEDDESDYSPESDAPGKASGGVHQSNGFEGKGKKKASARNASTSSGLSTAKPAKLAGDVEVVLRKLRKLRSGMVEQHRASGADSGEGGGASSVSFPSLVELGLGADVTEVKEMEATLVMDGIENIAVDVAESILNGKGFSFRVPTRSSGNQKYVEELDRIVLGDKVSLRHFISTAMARKTAITTRVIQLVHQVLGKGIHITKRDMFYTDVKLFKEQGESDAVLDDVACMVGCTRSCLNVVASDKGLVVGRVSFLEDGDLIDCTRMGVGGKAIPPYMDKISDIKSDADFILLVEKEAAYMRMAEDRFYQKYPCIVITAKGQPDVATRLFLKRLKRELNIPVMGLVDSDPYGLKILSVYMSGSKNMSYDSASLTTPDIKWLGVRPSDLDRYNIPEQCRLDMTEHDMKTGRELLREEFIKKNPDWYRELELMIQTRKKAEIQSLSAFGFQYLTETYLPQKLQNGDWV